MTDDLSKVHEPITNLFPQPTTTDQWEQYRLSESQLQHFEDNGYVAGIQLLHDEQIQRLRDQLAGFFDPNHEANDLWYEYNSNESGDPDNVLFHSLGAWRIGTAFHDILWNPAFTVPASQLLRGAVRFWHDQLFCKPAHHGGVVSWHQDYSFWTRTRPMTHLTCWIALDDVTDANGALHYVPGSHRWDLLPSNDLATGMEAVRENLNDQQKKNFDNQQVMELKAGQASFHHPLMMHGSYGNKTDIPRRATVINAIRDGVCSDSDQPLLEGVDTIPKGQPMGGQFFPLLFDPQRVGMGSGEPQPA